MDVLTLALLFLAGLISGAINAIAGGGTFITFAAFTFAGLSPIAANATSSVTQVPGYVSSTLAYLDDLRRFWRQALLLASISAVGALVGALILLGLDNPSFRALVPWLLLGATAVFAAGPWLKPTPRLDGKRNIWGLPVQFLTAVYGGFFGAGMGIMMLASLGLTEAGDYHRLNALKNFLSIIIATVAIGVFVSGGLIAWREAAVMIPAVAFGGYLGVALARRIPQIYLRSVVITVGLLLALYYSR